MKRAHSVLSHLYEVPGKINYHATYILVYHINKFVFRILHARYTIYQYHRYTNIIMLFAVTACCFLLLPVSSCCTQSTRTAQYRVVPFVFSGCTATQQLYIIIHGRISHVSACLACVVSRCSLKTIYIQYVVYMICI